MIRIPTVLILGAGASQHLDYPLGDELRRNIVAALQDRNSAEYPNLVKLKYSEVQIREFCEALSGAGKVTIDAFLEHRDNFVEIGKAAIAACLIKYERAEMFDASRCWYPYLFNKMNTTFDEFSENRLAFVTFNYDRSLEAFLFRALKYSYGKTDEETAAALAPIPIIHAYGSIGALPWQQAHGREYAPTISAEFLRAASEGIHIVHENSPDMVHFAMANRRIQSAKRVIFLGFGYDKTNLRRLGRRPKSHTIYSGSTYGMTPREILDLQPMFPSKKFFPGDPSWQILEFLRNEVSL